MSTMNSWAIKEFSEIAELSKEKFNPQQNRGDDRKCIELEHIEKETGAIIGHTFSSAQLSTKNVFNRGDVIFGKLRPNLRKYAYCDFDGVCSSETWVLKPREDMLARFLFYLVQSGRFISSACVTSGSKMPRASWDYVSQTPFHIPSPAEQEVIADTLQTWDTAIEKTRALVAAKEKQCDWLITRLVKNYKTTTRLREICSYEKGEKFRGDESTAKYLEIGDVNIASKDYEIDAKSKKPVQGAVKVPAGTTLVSTVRPTRGAITKTKAEVYVSPAFCRLKLPNDFFYYCLHQRRFFEWLEARQSGGTYPTVKDKDILNFKVPSPPISEQDGVAHTLNMATQEITLLKSLADQYQVQKRGLMQKLLTGKWRIPLSQNNLPGGNGNG